MMSFQKLMRAFEDVDFHRIERSMKGHDLVDVEVRIVPSPRYEAERLVLAVIGADGRKAFDV